MSTLDLDLIRTQNPIVELVREVFPLRQSGQHWIGIEHDSLVVSPRTGWYHWNSREEHGDVLDFVGRYQLKYGGQWSSRDPQLFMEAVAYLAQRVGINLPSWDAMERSTWLSERELVERLHIALWNTPEALDYAQSVRGWQSETLRRETIGYMPNNKRELLKDLQLSEKWSGVIQRFPAGMLVYVHLEQGQLTYLSGRSIREKAHYNPPHDLIGERRPYCNRCYHQRVEEVVVVEGQADAITFSEWGIPAIALAGMHSNVSLIEQLQNHRRVYVALDNTPEAQANGLALARAIGSSACIPSYPGAVKDANEWLVQQQASVKHVQMVLNNAQPLLEAEVIAVHAQMGLARQDGIKALIKQATHWEKSDQLALKQLMKDKLGIQGSLFNDMLKAFQPDKNDPNDQPQILSDEIPLLSPALGFTPDMALVTVSILERTAQQRLNIQPYIVTSRRDLRRLENKQLITLGGQEVALRVIPEGTEFLMRWRYRDIQRFLQGELVEPRQVFEAVHNLFTTYVDFTSPVDSKVVSLWVIGTYFYTMFNAYPYLALNGPKNSGKSTVLTVSKPLAFNMVATSDVTGPSLFRLIHHNSCTVGIDEAERYHNPRDPEMQQIRQLLNSGYKPGMPAIRLNGDEMKPLAFDVYSPKMLANITGLEDILASRCIPVAMRRTERKLPQFPPMYDGAEVRHQLYTLALTHYPAIYQNYYLRPELHKLLNRSHELWSPLIALAAFFEEVGEVEGLFAAIEEAAQRDLLTSDGKALSLREEAILQALEILTRDAQEEVKWLKATEIKEQVGEIMDMTADMLGSMHWIGQILKRLQLTDRTRRKSQADGQSYAIQRTNVLEMMRRYDVKVIQN